jgi:TPR repeat protein
MRTTLRTWVLAAVGAAALSAPAVSQSADDQAWTAYYRQDYATALRLLLPLAKEGDVAAQYRLGVMYDAGEGVRENDTEAVRWYRLAADQGAFEAQEQLAYKYWEGEGVPQNYVEASKWFALAAAKGIGLAKIARHLLQREMTPAQIAEAQKLAAEWKPKK